MSRRGRAAVVTGPGAVDVREHTVRHPLAGEVQVELAGSGVCGSNVPVWEGRPWFQYPLAPGDPGHESWGVVAATGDGVVDVRAGDAVAVVASGAFADVITVGEADVVVLPDALRGVPFPGEALGCGFNVARRSVFEDGDTVAVIGIGYLGAIVTRLAALSGARVIAISRRPTSLALARTMGATEVVPMDDHRRIIDHVTDLTDGALCRTVVEAVGTQWPLDLAGELTGVGGRLVVAGYHQDGGRQVDMQLWNWRGIDVINAHERDLAVVRRGVQEAAAAVCDGRLDLAALHTHTLPLDQLDQAMNLLVDRPEGFVKSLVVT